MSDLGFTNHIVSVWTSDLIRRFWPHHEHVGKTELILICFVAVALLAIVARRIRILYPILLTIGGVILALVPGLPAIHLEPELVLICFFPPLLYPSAVYTSWRDFRANLRSILLLTIVLVFLTMIAAAYVQTRTPVENVGRQSRKRATVASLLFRTQPIWGAQAASVLLLAACRRLPRVARIPCAECSKSFSAGCRKGQAGSCVLPRTDQIASKLISI